MHWFLFNYPLVFDEIHAFEMRTDGISQMPSAEAIRASYGARARPFEQGRFFFHSALVSTVDAPRPTAEQLGTKMTDAEIAKFYGVCARALGFR